MLETFAVVKKKSSLHPITLKGYPFFASFSVQQLEAIIASAHVVSPKAEQVILRQGEHLDAMYLILKGGVKVEGKDSAGMKYPFVEMGEGQICGELGLIRNEPSRATFTTTRDSDLLAIDRATLLNIIRNADPEQILNIFSVMDRQVSAASENGF